MRIDPEVRLIPATITGKDDPFAWVTFGGHWGERETWVYDGPTGPAFKTQWTAPVRWMEKLRADSIRVNGAAILGPAPTDIFCTVIETGSALFTLFTPYPLLVISIVGSGLALVIWALSQSWSTLRHTGRVYRAHVRVFAAIGSITVPATLTVSALHYLLATNADFAARTGLSEDSPSLQTALGVVALLQQGLLLLIVTPAVIRAAGDIAAGRPPSVRRAIREGFMRMPNLVWTLVRGQLVILGLAITLIGLPWAINRSVRWMFGVPAAVLDDTRGKSALDSSAEAVRSRWWQAAVNGAVLAVLGATPGILIGLVLLVVVRFPVDAANSVAALVYAVAHPFAIAGLTLLYLGWRGQPAPAPSTAPGPLPLPVASAAT